MAGPLVNYFNYYLPRKQGEALIHSFIHSLKDMYVSSAYRIPGTVLGI